MEASNFVENEEELERGLFTRYLSRGGAQTDLNINFVPDFLRLIKGRLTAEQLLRLQDYHLQNYLMELSVSYKEERTLVAITDRVLSHIRRSNNFWYKHNNKEQLDEQLQLKRHAINRYHRDMGSLREAFREQQNVYSFTPTYPRKTPLSHSFVILHGESEPHFGTRQPLNHISLIPAFVLRRRAQNVHKNQVQQKGQLGQLKCQWEGDSPIKNLLQECIIFVLSNKTQPKCKKREVYQQKQSQNEQEEYVSSSTVKEGEEVQSQKFIIEQFQNYLQGYSMPKIAQSHHMRTLTYNLIVICQQILAIKQHNKTPSKRQTKDSALETMDSIRKIRLNVEVNQIVSSISELQLEEAQANVLSSYFLDLWDESLQSITRQIREREEESSKMGRGWLNSPQEISKVKQEYLQLLDQPQFVQLTKYRALGTGVPWKEQDYLKFLKALNEYLNIPTNNKKIASAMGDIFEPNHVKHVKATYLITMKDRLERGECGGGKRGKCLSKSEFIERDISNFSIKWFQKVKKIYKKKPKRKRRNTSEEEGEGLSDSQY